MVAFKLEDWVPMSPLAGPPLPLWMHLYWPWYKPPGAQFKVSDLVISPKEVNPRQPVTISSTVTNIGAEAGDYIVRLGGDFVGEQTVTLQPSELKVISFEAIPHEARTYQVSVNGLTGSFTAVAAPQSFTFSNVSAKKVTMYDAPAWETIEFYCTITNPNDITVTELLKVMCRWGTGNASLQWTFELTLAPGQIYNFKWDGNRYGQRSPDAYNGPLVGRRQRVCMWLEDQEGNKSAEGCVTGSG